MCKSHPLFTYIDNAKQPSRIQIYLATSSVVVNFHTKTDATVNT